MEERRRIGFMRKEEREAEDKRMRATNHVKVCQEYAGKLLQLLYIQTPENAKEIMDAIDGMLYGNKE